MRSQHSQVKVSYCISVVEISQSVDSALNFLYMNCRAAFLGTREFRYLERVRVAGG
jgi:hypothetical protein